MEQAVTAAPARAPRRRRLASLAAKAALALVAVPLLALAALGLLLDTDLGHRLIIDRIAAMTPASGLRVRIGRLEGSIWGETEVRDLRLFDQDGLFAEAPQVTLEWRPFAWLTGRLLIDDVSADLAIVHRAPDFIPADEGGGFSLPRYDVHVGRLEIAQLRFEEAVAGAKRIAQIGGEAEYRSGRFLLDLEGVMRGGGDRLDLLVDAFPDRDRFDLDLALDAPADGVLARMLGTRVPVRLAVSGDGSWQSWNGTARLQAAGREAGDFRLAARAGRYRAQGWLAPAGLLQGRIAGLAAPRLALDAQGRIERSVLSGRIAGRSAAMRFALAGGADLGSRRYRELGLSVELLRAAPLFAAAEAGPGTRLTAMIDGPFDRAILVYRAAAPTVRSGSTVLDQLRAAGSGGWSGGRLTLPVSASAARLTGQGAPILADLRLSGSATLTGSRLAARNLSLTAGRARARFALEADLAADRYVAVGTAAAEDYEMAGLGLADLRGEWRASSSAFSGTIRGTLRRVDQPALAWAARGPIGIESGLASGPDASLRFTGLRLAAPGLRLEGSGRRSSDGAIVVEARGRQTSLGPLRLRYRDERLALLLARPAPALGLADVAVEIGPAGRGFGYRARGRSPLGRFEARGNVWPAADMLRVASLSVAGATGSGTLRAADGGLAGRLDFGGALAGPIHLGWDGGRQTVAADLVARDATIAAVPIGSGRIEAALAVAGGTTLSGRVRFQGAADRLWQAAGWEGTRLSGPIAVEAELGGTLAAPTVDGRVRLAGGRLAAGGLTIEEIAADGRFDAARLILAAFRGRSGGGRIEGSGTVAFGGALDLRLEGDRIALARRGLDSQWRGRLRVGGTVSAPLLLGEAMLIRGSYRLLGRPIELRRGTMRFDGTADPLLDIVTAPPGGFGPGIRITGRASRPLVGLAPLGSRRPLPALPPQSETAPARGVRRGRLRSRGRSLSSNNTCRIRPGWGSSPSAAAPPI